MDFVPVYTFDNYIDANILLGRLMNENINCWLKDENTSTIAPIWNQAIGGIKLMVVKSQAERAIALLKEYKQDSQARSLCPNCGSSNVEFISTPRKASNWFSAILGFLFGSYAVTVDKVYHCFNCNHEFESSPDINTPLEEKS